MNIRGVIRSQFGEDFDVEDIGMWRYAPDLYKAPFEFAVVVRPSFSFYACCMVECATLDS